MPAQVAFGKTTLLDLASADTLVWRFALSERGRRGSKAAKQHAAKQRSRGQQLNTAAVQKQKGQTKRKQSLQQNSGGSVRLPNCGGVLCMAGARVQARWQGGPHFYPGVIASINSGA